MLLWFRDSPTSSENQTGPSIKPSLGAEDPKWGPTALLIYIDWKNSNLSKNYKELLVFKSSLSRQTVLQNEIKAVSWCIQAFPFRVETIHQHFSSSIIRVPRSQGLNPHCQAWRQVPLPGEPYCQSLFIWVWAFLNVYVGDHAGNEKLINNGVNECKV